jgi:hypothetical protein
MQIFKGNTRIWGNLNKEHYIFTQFAAYTGTYCKKTGITKKLQQYHVNKETSFSLQSLLTPSDELFGELELMS